MTGPVGSRGYSSGKWRTWRGDDIYADSNDDQSQSCQLNLQEGLPPGWPRNGRPAGLFRRRPGRPLGGQTGKVILVWYLKSVTNVANENRNWLLERGKSKPSLYWALFKTFAKYYVIPFTLYGFEVSVERKRTRLRRHVKSDCNESTTGTFPLSRATADARSGHSLL